jgi:hypothetical protein
VKFLRGDDPFGFNELSRYNQLLLLVLIAVFGANVLLSDWLLQSPSRVYADGVIALVLSGLLITARSNKDTEKP